MRYFCFLCFLLLSASLLPLAVAQENTVPATPPAPVAPAAPADPFKDPLIIEVQKLHTKSEGGSTAATKELIETLLKLTKEHPKNDLLLAYLGSAYTLASRDAWPGPSKLDYLKNGLKAMDQAVNNSPDDLAVRFIRAINNYQLPSFVGRRDDARKDFEILLLALQKNPQALSNETRQAIYYFAGLAYKQTKKVEEARKIWKEGYAIDANSELAAKIAAELKKIGV